MSPLHILQCAHYFRYLWEALHKHAPLLYLHMWTTTAQTNMRSVCQHSPERHPSRGGWGWPLAATEGCPGGFWAYWWDLATVCSAAHRKSAPPCLARIDPSGSRGHRCSTNQKQPIPANTVVLDLLGDVD